MSSDEETRKSKKTTNTCPQEPEKSFLANFSKPLTSFGFSEKPLFSFDSLPKEEEEPDVETSQVDDSALLIPKIQKLEKVALVTGEEDEETVFSVHAKLYVLEKEFKERGSGTVKINVKDSKARIVMRADKVLNVLLNTLLIPGSKCTVIDRQVRFVAFEDKIVPIAFRLQTEKAAQDLCEQIQLRIPKEKRKREK